MKVTIWENKYTNNNRFALGLDCLTSEGWQPYANITVNLVDETIPFDTEEVVYGFVDANNFPKAEEFIRKSDIGEKTNFEGHSGYCTYPLYRFDKKKISKLASSQKEFNF